jgi:hypothetical protein
MSFIYSYINTHTLIYFFCSIVVKVHDHLETCQVPIAGDGKHFYDHLEFTDPDTLKFWGYDRSRFDYNAKNYGPPTMEAYARPKPPAGPPPPDSDDDDWVSGQASKSNALLRGKATAHQGQSTEQPERFTIRLSASSPGPPKQPSGPPPPKASRISTIMPPPPKALLMLKVQNIKHQVAIGPLTSPLTTVQLHNYMIMSMKT